MAVLTVQNIVPGGLAFTTANAAGGGDTFFDDGTQRTFLSVHNSSGGSITVTVARQYGSGTTKVRGFGDLTVPDRPNAVSVVAGGRTYFGPFPHAYIATDGLVSVAYSAATGVNVAVFRLPLADE